MPDNRQVIRVATLKRPEVLPFMAAMAPHFQAALTCEARFGATPDGSLRIVLPHWNDRPRRPEAEVVALRAALRAAVEAATGTTRSVPVDVISQTLDGMLDIVGAALTVLYLGASDAQTMAGQGNPEKLAVLRGQDDAVIGTLAATLRRSRYPTLAVSCAAGDDPLTVIHLTDDSDAGATLDGLRAGLPPGALAVLAARETSAGRIYLPDHLSYPTAQRLAAGAVMQALTAQGWLGFGAALLLVPQPGDGLLACQMPPETPFAPAVELIPEAEATSWMTLAVQQILPSAAAAGALAARIVGPAFPVGYKVALRPVPDRLRQEADVEMLREEIEEREAEIGLIRALAAAQLRLLRFTDAQLPALVDGLRLMPPAMQLSDHLTFATAQSAGQDLPNHFILYDPSRLSIEGRLPEYYWRQKTDDHPIGYWLDPFASAAMTGSQTDPLIFVPVRQHIIPRVSGFGGQLDQTMRLVLGNLFADASVVLDNPMARPMFVFSPSSEPGFDLAVEVLDRAKFAPINLRLRWINEHIQVRSPRLFEPGTISAIADAAFSADAATKLAETIGADLQKVSAAWAEGEAVLTGQIGDITRHLTAEVVEAAERIRLSIDYLNLARKRIAEVDSATQKVQIRLGRVEGAVSGLQSLVDAKAAARNQFANDLLAEIEAGERTVEQAVARMRDLKAGIALIRRQWSETE